MKSSVNYKRKQGGMASLDKLIAVAAMVIGIMWLLSQQPKAEYNENLTLLQMQVSDVKTASRNWKKRGTYTGVSMAVLCTNSLLDDVLCSGTPGQNVNAFGGHLTIAVNSTNPALRTIVVTIPNDADKVNDIAATLANLTRDQCVSMTGCSTISVTGTSITLTV
ncbi:type II secretion system protein [Vibrio ostreicida]|uniref:type II secretion system protein n=1 Tax=Vibrio ostreicida TaxID=526588 RepID=UPI003B5ABD75